jgi:hypothetical protein
VAAAAAARGNGLHIVDAFTPFAVHGLDEAMGLRPSRLTWICLLCGLLGALGMLWFEHWTAATSWPIDVGGKPWNSLPSDVPVAFEAAVLLAGFGSVIALLIVSRLYPGKQARMICPRLTDDQFALVIDEVDAGFDLNATRALLSAAHAIRIEEQLIHGGDGR